MDFAIVDSRPIWQQLAEQLRRRVVTGFYPAGSRLPSVRDLAAEAGVNPNTMQRAVTQLETDDLIVTNRTAGRTVTEDTAILEKMRKQLASGRVRAFFTDMGTLGYSKDEAAALAEEERKESNGE